MENSPLSSKMKLGAGYALIISTIVFAGRSSAQDDPCKDKQSNTDVRDCYRNQQLLVNRQADSLVHKIEVRLRRDGHDVKGQGEIAASLLLKSASSLAQSQSSWKSYRDEHCKAVMYSWTIGSGAGTAYEGCMYQMGKARLQELKSDFPNDSGQP